jgi:hypothetical protein
VKTCSKGSHTFLSQVKCQAYNGQAANVKNERRSEGMAEVVEHLTIRSEVLSFNTSTDIYK